MALFDFKKLDNLFHPQAKAQDPHPPEVHAPHPVSPAPAPIPRAKPVVEKPPVPPPAPAHAEETAKPKASDHVPAPTPAPAANQSPAPSPDKAPKADDPEHRALVTHQMEEMKEKKTLLKPGDKGPNVVILQSQLKQLGLHVEQTGVMDKGTEGYVMALQTGAGLGADGVVGPKTMDQLLKLDVSPQKPAPGGDQAAKEDNVDHMPDDPKLAAVYLYNQQRVKNAKEDLNDSQKRDMEQFIK